jgi:hypothetical protein
MFRPTSVTISTAVENVLIECSCIAEILPGMSVVCELIDWLRAVENWECLAKMKFYGISSKANKLMRSYLEN